MRQAGATVTLERCFGTRGVCLPAACFSGHREEACPACLFVLTAAGACITFTSVSDEISRSLEVIRTISS